MSPSLFFRRSPMWHGAVGLAVAAGLLALVPPPSFAAAPSNDMFATPDALGDAFGAVVGTTAEATKEAGEPDHAGVLGNKSVWFTWTAPRSGRVVFDTRSWRTDFDTVLAAYTGVGLDGLVPVAANDDLSRFSRHSSMVFTATSGTTYLVALDGVAGKSGDYRLHWAMEPTNDSFAASESIAGRSGTTATDNTLATLEESESRYSKHSVWYRWTAPHSRRVEFNTQGSGFDTRLAVYTGRSLSALRLLARNDDARGLRLRSRVTFVAQAGRTYRVAVGSYPFGGGSGRVVLSWLRP